MTSRANSTGYNPQLVMNSQVSANDELASIGFQASNLKLKSGLVSIQ